MPADMVMVERVARALAEVAYAPTAMPELYSRLDYIRTCWPGFQPQARAAIEAMREPSDQMVLSALEGGLKRMQDHGVTAISPFEDYPSPSGTARVMWSAMITAALQEPRG